MPITMTSTETYTKPRIDVISDHFELFLRCGGMNDKQVDNFLQAVEQHELEAVGIYIEENNSRIAEVEFAVDWEKHDELVHIYGEIFDTDSPGFRDGVSPEAYVAVSRLVKAAKANNLKVRSWILVSENIMHNKAKHKKVCKKLGYAFGSQVPEWGGKVIEQARKVEGLEECEVISRQVR